MSINKKIKEEAYLIHKKNPYIKRSVLAKRFDISHKTVTKALEEERILDIKKVINQGIDFYKQILLFQDKYRNSITQTVAQSSEYKKWQKEHEEYQNFLQIHLKEFNEQVEKVKDKLDNEVRVKHYKSGVDLEHKEVIKMMKPVKHLIDPSELITPKQFLESKRKVVREEADKIFNKEREKILKKLNEIYEKQKA